MKHCRENGVIPNYTTHGLDITPEKAQLTKDLCGAVAVSVVNKEKTYNTVKMFTDTGMDQVNIHYTLSDERFDGAFNLMKDTKEDPRLEKLNAIVFLSLKQKGRGHTQNNVTFEKYKKLVDYAMENNIRIDFDSCSAPLFLAAVKDRPEYKIFEQLSEPCESFLFSIYINTFGEVTPCSFLEDEGYKPINVLEVDDFMKDVWYSDVAKQWRETLLNTEKKCSIKGCRMCPHYDIYPQKLYKEV
jgi:MoaA/NifB/PqqE/SkfB family radical SAM enzyme